MTRRTFFNSLVGLLGSLMLMVIATGCELGGGGGDDNSSRIFINNSSYTVRVTPNGQTSWSGFLIGSGETREISFDPGKDGDKMYISYSGGVACYTHSDDPAVPEHTFEFRNR